MLGGGSFTGMNKVLPGAYINFVSASSSVAMGSRGVAALPLLLNWGPEKKVYTLDASEFNKVARTVFGYDPTAPEMLLIREALKRAKTLLIYRANSGGDKAKADVGGMTVTAIYGGTRGNDIRVAVQSNPDDATYFDVVTYLDGEEVDTQTVKGDTGSVDLIDNAFVTFGKADTLTAVIATPLSGGTNGSVTGGTYADFLNAIEVENFNVVGYPGDDDTVKALLVAFVQRLREDEGKKVVGVVYNYAADNMGVINVKNGYVLTDGTVLTGDKAVAYVAGASAGAEINQSLTNDAVDGAVDVDQKFTKTQYEAAIRAGEFVFYSDNGKARVLADINSLTTFTTTVSSDWTSNRLIRTLDGWANDVAVLWAKYCGKANNNDSGRLLFKADLVALATQYQDIEAIQNFDSADIEVAQGNGKRDVAVTSSLNPVDAMEKLYMTTYVA